MKKFLSCLCLLVVVVGASVLMVGCKSKVENIALKHGEIKSSYYVGESFDYTSGELVVKIGKDYINVPLTDKDVEILNFSTQEVVTSAVATIRYKGKSTTFTYSVSLHQANFIIKDEKGLNITGLIQKIDYDGNLHDFVIELDEGIDNSGVTVTKKLVETGNTSKTFDGAKDAGIYVVDITVSKPGYATVTKRAGYKINPREIEAELFIAQVGDGGTLAEVKAEDCVYNGKAYEVLARPVGVITGDEVNITISGVESAENAGIYKTFCVGCDNTNYVLKQPQKSNYPNMASSVAEPELYPLEWEIKKANLTSVTNDTVGFLDKTVTYDGKVQSITATKELKNPTPTSTGYVYFNSKGETVNEAKEVGVYTVKATYTFENYNDVVLTATLTITAAPKEPVEYKFLSHYAGTEFGFDCTDNTITVDVGGTIEVTESDTNGNVLAFVYKGDTFRADI